MQRSYRDVLVAKPGGDRSPGPRDRQQPRRESGLRREQSRSDRFYSKRPRGSGSPLEEIGKSIPGLATEALDRLGKPYREYDLSVAEIGRGPDELIVGRPRPAGWGKSWTSLTTTAKHAVGQYAYQLDAELWKRFGRFERHNRATRATLGRRAYERCIAAHIGYFTRRVPLDATGSDFDEFEAFRPSEEVGARQGEVGGQCPGGDYVPTLPHAGDEEEFPSPEVADGGRPSALVPPGPGVETSEVLCGSVGGSPGADLLQAVGEGGAPDSKGKEKVAAEDGATYGETFGEDADGGRSAGGLPEGDGGERPPSGADHGTGVPGGPAQVAGGLNDLPNRDLLVPRNMTSSQVDLLQSMLPELEVKPVLYPAAHDHPVAHWFRAGYLQFLVNKWTRQLGRPVKIYAVGLKPAHFIGVKDAEVWFDVSPIAPRDELRYSGIKQNRCECESDCPHLDQADFILLWERTYYVSPDLLAARVKSTKGRVFSVHSSFPDVRGAQFVTKEGPEFRYDREADGSVTVTADRGTLNNYRHSAADWLKEGYHRLAGDTCLAWWSHSSRQHVETVEFQVLEMKRPEAAAAVDVWNTGGNYYGPATFGPYVSTPVGPEFNGLKGYSVGQHVLLADTKVVVSKDAVAAFSLWAQGRELDEDYENDAFNAARLIMKHLRLPLTDKAEQISWVVAFGTAHAVTKKAATRPALKGFKDEMRKAERSGVHRPFYKHLPKGATRRVLKRVAVVFEKLERATREERRRLAAFLAPVMKFLFGKGMRTLILGWAAVFIMGKTAGFAAGVGSPKFFEDLFELCKFAWQLAGMATGYLADWILEKITQPWKLLKTIFRKFGDWAKAVVAWVRKHFCKKDLDADLAALVEEEERAFNEGIEDDVDAFEGTSAGIGDNDILLDAQYAGAGITPDDVLHDGPVVGERYCSYGEELPAMREDAKVRVPPDEPCIGDRPVVCVGLACSDVTVTEDCGCVSNQVKAIVTRVMRPLPPHDETYWQGVDQRLPELFDVEVAPVEWKAFVAPYPNAKKRRLVRSYKFLVLADHRRAAIRLAHVKRENGYAYRKGQMKPHDPRLIQATTAEESNFMGPAVAALHWKLLEVERFDNIAYAPGMKSEALDQFVEDVETELSVFDEPLVYFYEDSVRLDSSQHKRAHVPFGILLGKMGDVNASNQYAASTPVKGVTRSDAKFSTEDGLGSGQIITTAFNTTAVGEKVNHCLRKHPGGAAIAGDDVFGVTIESHWKGLRDDLENAARQAGYVVEMGFSYERSDAEFCSGRFWPASCKRGFAFGCKPGKLLPKLFATSKPESFGRIGTHLRSVALGLEKSVEHIPVANVTIKHILNWVGEGKVRKSYEHRDSYKIKRVMGVKQSNRIYEEFARIYGTTRAEVRRLEKKILETPIPGVYSSRLMKKMNKVDRTGAPRAEHCLAAGARLGCLDGTVLTAVSVLASTAACAVAYAIGGRTLRRFALCVTVPIIEEFCRMVDPVGYTAGLICHEAMVYGLAPHRWPSLALHSANALGFTTFGFWYLPAAIAAHVAFNSACVLLGASGEACGLEAPESNFLPVMARRKFAKAVVVDVPKRPRRNRRGGRARRGNGGAPRVVFVPPLPPRGRQYRRARSNLRRVTGYGDYKTDMYDKHRIKDFEGNFAADYGERLGESFGGKQGGVIGEGLQSLAKIFGYGDYSGTKIEENSLILGGDPPVIDNVKRNDETIFRHREFLGDVLTAAGTVSPINIDKYQFDPSNQDLAPWLSDVITKFGEYEWRGALIEFKSTCSEGGTSLAEGSVFLSMNYDVDAPDPTTKIECENTEYAMSEKPSKTCIMPVECKRSRDVQTHLYVPPGGEIPAGKDAHLYALGNVYVGSEGVPNVAAAATKIGELWFTYEVAAWKPKMDPSKSEGLAVHWCFDSYTNARPVGSAAPLIWKGDTEFVVDTVNNKILFPPSMKTGVFLVNLYYSNGTNVTWQNPTVTQTNCTKLVYWKDDAASNAYAPSAGTALVNAAAIFLVVRVDAEDATINFATDGTIPAAGLLDIWIVELPASIDG